MGMMRMVASKPVVKHELGPARAETKVTGTRPFGSVVHV